MALLEVCAADAASVRAAVAGGAARIELCAGLSADGMTPSAGLIRVARELTAGCVALNILLRPNEDTGFRLSADENRVLAADIELAAQAAADGIVLGALDGGRMPDVKMIAPLVRQARDMGLSVTFHRAFDRVARPAQALEMLIDMGCDRVLTSGLAPTAPEGIDMLASLVNLAGNRIIVMPGAGISPANVRMIADLTGARELHGSCRRAGATCTDADTVRAIVDQLSDN